MDDAGVVAGLVRAHLLLALEHLDAHVGVAGEQLAGDGQAEDAGADHRQIARAVGLGHAALATAPRERNAANASATYSSAGRSRPG